MKEYEILLINTDNEFLYKRIKAYDRKHLLSVLFYFSLQDVEVQEFILHTSQIKIKEIRGQKNELLHDNK